MIVLQKSAQLTEQYDLWKENGFYLNYKTSFTNLRNNQNEELREIYKSIKYLKIKENISGTIKIHRTFSETEFENRLKEAIGNEEVFNRYKNLIQQDTDKKNITNELRTTFNKYKRGNIKYWIKQDYLIKIQEFLFPTSYEKCAYCERKPNRGGGNLEVEHFYPKADFDFESAFSFGNLLPSCKQCNTKKGTNYKFRIKEIEYDILNPYNEDFMRQHIGIDIKTLKLVGLSNNGKATVELLKTSLNTDTYKDDNNKRQKGALHFRRTIAKQINDKFEQIRELKEDIERNIANNRFNEASILQNRIIRNIKRLLNTEIKPENSLTATRATLILTNRTLDATCELIKGFNEIEYIEIKRIINEKKRYCLKNIF